MRLSLVKSILHNLGVVIVGFGFGGLGVLGDWVLGWPRFQSVALIAVGGVLILLGFLLRVWATYHFYRHKMRVIQLSTQSVFITTGPYRYTRNPLYLGGNVFIFLGAVLFFGSPAGILLTVINVVAFNAMIKREERQLEQAFGEQWATYKKKVRRWI